MQVDVGEKHDLSRRHPRKVAELTKLYDAWLDSMAEPINGAPKRWKPGVTARRKPRNKADKQKQREERRKKKQAERKKTKPVPVSIAVPIAAPAKRYNVLLIVCDDLNTHVSTSGYQHIKTPAFDALAASGMTLRRAYCQYPVCGPSRASFLSGLYPESTGVLDNKSDIRRARPAVPSMPQQFKSAGYWTGGVGKVFHGPKGDHGKVAWNEYRRFENAHNPVLRPIQQAFEAKHGSVDDPKNRQAWRAKLRELRAKTSGQSPPGYGPTEMTDAEHRDGKNARQIAKWIEQRAHGEAPFFLVCGIQKPHVPFWAPKKYFEMYPREKLTLSPVPTDDWSDIPSRAMVKRYRAFGFELGKENDPLRREYTQAYHACISFIDAQIGLMLDALKRSGRDRDTIVVLTSDHGYHLGEHFMWGKVTLFEECARVPLVIRVPGRTKAGSVSQSLVELVDLFPTLAELCRVETPGHVMGSSFAATLSDSSTAHRRNAYSVVSRGAKLGRSIRTRRYRYAEWGGAGENELYDLASDPSEHMNLAKQAEFQKLVADMRRQLNARQAAATTVSNPGGKKVAP
jgi:arylsulfatase A-like enzyme